MVGVDILLGIYINLSITFKPESKLNANVTKHLLKIKNFYEKN
jgi:hypothetical protein